MFVNPKHAIDQGLIRGIRDEAKQVQPNAVDFTLDADSLQMVKKLKSVVDFDLPLTKDSATLARIQHNIDLTLGLFTDTTVAAWFAKE